jgi:outer membrane protein insertion porin family
LNKTIYIKCLVNTILVQNLHKIGQFVFLLFLTSCNVTQFLEKDQHIVAKNIIDIKEIDSRSVRNGLKTDLATLYKQKQLKTFLGLKSKSSAWFYYKEGKDANAGKFNKWMYRNFGKRPYIFDTAQTNLTVKTMKQYLINRGYRYPSVFYEKDFHGKDKGFADVTYFVNPGTLYVFDTINIRCIDTAIQYLLSDSKSESFLKTGLPLSLSLYEKERGRITTLMQNNGYARFTPNFISQLDADTIETGVDKFRNRRVNVNLNIQLPTDKPSHQIFHVGDVRIFPNYDARYELPTNIDSFYNGKFYYTNGKKSNVKISTIDNALSIVPNTLYSRQIETNILKRMNTLGYYRFININTNVEECDTTILQYNILLTPGKKMSFETGAEINYSNITGQNTGSSGVALGRMGVALDFQFTNRNFLGGAETFRSSLTGGVDFGISADTNVNNGLSSDIRFDNILSFPKFINPTRTFRLMNRWNWMSDNFYNEIKDNTTTDYNLSYTYTDRLALNLYRLNQFNLGKKYVLNRKNGLERATFSPWGVELILSELDPVFQVNANPRTIRSLDKQLLTGLFFRTFSFEKNLKTKLRDHYWQFNFSLEQSGSEIWLVDKIRGTKQKPLELPDTLLFSKFWKTELDIRFNDRKEISSSRGHAFRLAMGIASSFGDAPYVPYSRQFFVGGPNSIRGWQARGIGPGSFRDTSNVQTLPFQTGDIKIEFNYEYRFPIWWIFNSAIFLDGGNVWALKSSDPSNVFSKFWFDQFALSSGMGLRVDVKYALIRLDLGFKLRNPYQDENKHNWIRVRDYSWKNNVNLNFALGLPF